MIRKYAWNVLAHVGLPAIFRRLNRDKLLILMYHAVVDENHSYERWTHVHAVQFAEQMRYLRQNYSVLPLSEVVHRMACGKEIPPYSAVVTFDDGFRNNYSVAFPILREHGVPASIFLTTGFIESGDLNWPDQVFITLRGAPAGHIDLADFGLGIIEIDSIESRDDATSRILVIAKQMRVEQKNQMLASIYHQVRGPGFVRPDFTDDFSPLTWEECRTMQASGLVEFGAHTVNHEILSQLPSNDLKYEIECSYRTILESLGLEKAAFAYPNGRPQDFDNRCKDVLAEIGATCALTTVDSLVGPRHADLLALQRVGIGSDTTPSFFALKCSGLHSAIRRLANRS